MTASVAVVGISSERTPGELRERVHLAPDGAAVLSREVAGEGREAVALATCNRTELYVAASEAGEAVQAARRAIAHLGLRSPFVPSVYAHTNEDAARHLFRVAAGLESIVLGDTHVAAQVREAHHLARHHGATGPILDRLFEAASGASKVVRAQTTVSTGATTIAGAAVAVAARLAGPLASRRVLVIGAGPVATVAALGAGSRGCREVVVANRSFERALELARRVDGRGIRLDELDRELASADVVFSATASRGSVLTQRHAEARSHVGRPLLVFDLALPRDVDPAFRRLSDSRVLDLDDLAQIMRESRSEREAGLGRANAIICDQAARWERWRRARQAAPAIAEMHEEAQQARRLVLGRHASDLAQLAPHEQRLVETITAQLLARLLHAPTVELRRRALGTEG